MINNKFRILLTVPHLSSTASPYREMMALATYLPRDEFQLSICSLRENGFNETAPILIDLGCPVLVGRFRPRGKTPRHLASCLADQKLISQFGPFDIQHSLDFTTSPLEAIMAKVQLRKFIFNQRSMALDGHRFGLWLKIRLASKIVAISDAIKGLLLSLGGERKIIKIVLGIDQCHMNIEKISAEKKSRYILSVGHITRLKRHQDAIKVLARLVHEIPELRLLIAGEFYDRNYYQELLNLSAALGVNRRVIFLGASNDILFLMKNASALLLCSESEGLPWVILEAMSLGLPVVAAEADGQKELITSGFTGFLVPVSDIEGYAKSLRQVILNPACAHFLSNNAAILIANHYSVQEMVANYADLYREVLNI